MHTRVPSSILAGAVVAFLLSLALALGADAVSVRPLNKLPLLNIDQASITVSGAPTPSHPTPCCRPVTHFFKLPPCDLLIITITTCCH